MRKLHAAEFCQWLFRKPADGLWRTRLNMVGFFFSFFFLLTLAVIGNDSHAFLTEELHGSIHNNLSVGSKLWPCPWTVWGRITKGIHLPELCKKKEKASLVPAKSCHWEQCYHSQSRLANGRLTYTSGFVYTRHCQYFWDGKPAPKSKQSGVVPRSGMWWAVVEGFGFLISVSPPPSPPPPPPF